MPEIDDRIHACLDGDLPLSALSPDERERVRRLRQAIDPASAPLRETAVPDFRGSVLTRLQTVPAPRPRWAPVRQLRAALDWLLRPRRLSFAMRPVYALPVLVLIVLGTAFALRPGTGAGPVVESAAEEAREPVVYVQFQLRQGDASTVSLAGTFSGWEPSYRLTETAPGVWTVLVPVTPGVHEYAFVIDGDRWVVDPGAPVVSDDFGGENNRLPVLFPEGHAS